MCNEYPELCLQKSLTDISLRPVNAVDGSLLNNCGKMVKQNATLVK